MPENEKNQPDAVGEVHKRQAGAVEICRDVYAGTLRLRDKRDKYLPRFPKEPKKKYEQRADQAVLYNAFKRTVRGLVGMVFKKEPKLKDDVPKAIKEHAENIDLQGRALHVFARDFFEESWIDGHAHIFVDCKRVDSDEIVSWIDEQAEVRPYWIIIQKQDVIRFRTVTVGGRKVLVRLAYREVVLVEDGEYGEREEIRIREYRLAPREQDDQDTEIGVEFTVKAKRKNEDNKEVWVLLEHGWLEGMQRVPLATGYTNRTGFMESEPALLDQALENVRHFQLRSDRDNSLHTAGIPIPVLIGYEGENEKLETASDIGFTLPLHGDAKYLEPQGTALEATGAELEAIEKRMMILGLSTLHKDHRGVESGVSKQIDKAETDSQLAMSARGLSDVLEEALGLHAEWLGVDKPRGEDGGSIGVNTDFGNIQITPEMIRELREDVLAEQISLETKNEILERGDIMPDGWTPELERERLANEGARLR